MTLEKILILLSSLSFFGYSISYFAQPKMKKEFERFGLSKYATAIVLGQLACAIGLLIGLSYPLVLSLSAFGLALQMFAGVIVRMKLKDSFLITLPALFFMILNSVILILTLT
ncbi:MAG: DoxX family protein [Flavobacteriales bacterium]